ncbi:MAG TPA: glycosyltransferase family 39 protein [Gemmatimonadaceae bacterium]|nr:glycosyltransferase family 39 protein [Gemmatimonadaceae bacterium]
MMRAVDEVIQLQPRQVIPPSARRSVALLLLIIVFSVILNVWGNSWGAPNYWHPDELTKRAVAMVQSRDPNPHYFTYGNLHYYLIAVGAYVPVRLYEAIADPHPSARDSTQYARWDARHLSRIIVAARAISAILATLIVAITAMMATILFEQRVGLLAALLLGVSPMFVYVAHFATVDVAASFWYWLACLLALLAWKRPGRYWLVAAALVGGLAIGTKLDRVLVVIPLAVALALRERGGAWRRAPGMIGFVALGALIATPVLFLSPFEYLDGVTRDFFYNAMRNQVGRTYFGQVLHLAASGLSIPLLVVAVGGVLGAAIYAVHGERRPAILWLYSAVVPFWLLYSVKSAQPWYLPGLFPAVTIFAAWGSIAMARHLTRRSAVAVSAIVALAGACALLRTTALLHQFTHDPRDLARVWIAANVPAGATISMLRRGPVVAPETYDVIRSHPDPDYYAFSLIPEQRLAHDGMYRTLRAGILAAERWAGRTVHFPVRAHPYVGWFDRVARERDSVRSGEGSMLRARGSDADYVVLLDPLQQETLAALSAPASGYRLVAHFGKLSLFGLEPGFPFTNLPVSIFRSVDRHPAAQRNSAATSRATAPAIAGSAAMPSSPDSGR